MKFEKGWIKDRLRSLVYKMLSASFLTWSVILIAYFANKQTIGLNFLIFTAAVIGIKIFKPGNPAGGATP